MAADVAALNLSLLFFLVFVSTLGPIAADDLDNMVFQARNGNMPAFGTAKPMRYLLYDVNPGEGFNLRRDVYMRVANLVKFLNEDEPWTLVLPPWGRLYHWKTRSIDQIKIPWKTFFDVESLGRHVPVIEYEDYIKITGKPEIDEVYYLQRYKEGWKDGKWEERMDERECIDPTGYEQDESGLWRGWFWGYADTTAKQFKCISIQAHAGFIKPFLIEKTKARSVTILRAESLIHGKYDAWSKEYWAARRSMRFSKDLQAIGDKFRKEKLDSTDEKDKTVLENDWRRSQTKHGDALGGPYIAVHLRRRDYLYAHEEDIPSVKGAAAQLKEMLDKNKLKKLFVATDAPKEEFEELKGYLKDYKVVKYKPPTEVLEQYKDGGIAIIDQWICAHARVFVGSYVSTFTFRIHEEREILGFNPDTTYNRLCADDKTKECEQPSRWHVVY